MTEMLQRTLLPDGFPQVPGLRFSAKYLAAGSGLKVGGDWYDVFQLPNGCMALVIGDVVGRGVMAASVMAEARTALRAYLIEGHSLREAMSLLNDLLISLGRDRAATVAILELDLELGEVDALSAGHLPAVVVDGGGPRASGTCPRGRRSGSRTASGTRASGARSLPTTRCSCSPTVWSRSVVRSSTRGWSAYARRPRRRPRASMGRSRTACTGP